jgi:hypothetical protein
VARPAIQAVPTTPPAPNTTARPVFVELFIEGRPFFSGVLVLPGPRADPLRWISR